MREFLVPLFIVCSLCVTDMNAQEVTKRYEKVFNFGVKAGLNSILTDVKSIDLQGMNIDNIRSINDVGYSIELFGRFNISRFFIQPSVCLKYSQGEIRFDILQSPLVGTYEPRITEASLGLEIKSIEVPFMVGYNLIKEKPYVLGIMAGPKFKYNYDISYSSMWYMENDENYYVSLCSTVEVVIGRLTFDFGYEYGLNRMRTSFDYMPNPADCRPLKMKSKSDGLSMSIGILF